MVGWQKLDCGNFSALIRGISGGAQLLQGHSGLHLLSSESLINNMPGQGGAREGRIQEPRGSLNFSGFLFLQHRERTSDDSGQRRMPLATSVSGRRRQRIPPAKMVKCREQNEKNRCENDPKVP